MKKKEVYRINAPDGIDEKIYVPINDQEQYLFIRSQNVRNPVILNLHGGPASPDAYMIYEFAREISADYTFVSWDQRGCGRTYFRNKHIDPDNKTATFEQAISDVDALITYLCKRFNQEKVIIIGHSYGTLLGVSYTQKYPEKVEKYIGIGQTVSLIKTQSENYREIMKRANQEDRQVKEITAAYNALIESPDIEKLTHFQRMTIRCFLSDKPKVNQKSEWNLIFGSPDITITDVRWLLGMIRVKKHFERNKQLLDYTLKANIYDIGNEFLVPMYFISGEYDKACNVSLVREYYNKITAPEKEMVVIKYCGHSPQIDTPIEFAEEVKRLLSKRDIPHRR